VNKNLTFGGIITNIQHRVSNAGKGWGIFTLEGYEESFEFKIFGEEYGKFRHFFIQNNFTYIKVAVKEGYLNRETGKKGEPRLQFLNVHYLQDVLSLFAKKLVINLDIKNLNAVLIDNLNVVFQKNKGNNQIEFEILETQKVLKTVEVETQQPEQEEIMLDADENSENLTDNNLNIITTEIEEVKVITKLVMPSLKLKIQISSELLSELEKMEVNFSLN
jgi:DNA polymerase-3 subunit alpha